MTADPGVASSILARSHTFVEIDHEIISTVVLLPSADSRRVVDSYKRKYVHEVLVNCLVKLAQVKSVARLTDHPDMTKAVDRNLKNQNKPSYLAMWVQGGRSLQEALFFTSSIDLPLSTSSCLPSLRL